MVRASVSLLSILGVVPEADEGVKAGDGTAHDGDEDEGEDGAFDDGAAGEEGGVDGGGLQLGPSEDDADDEQCDGADFEEAGEIIARQEQDRDREDGWR